MGCGKSKKKPPEKIESEFTEDEIAILSHFWTNLRESNADSGLFIFEHFFTLYPEEMERFDELKDMYGNIQPNYMKEEFIHHHGIKVMDAIDLVMQGVFKRKPDAFKPVVEVGYDHLDRKIPKESVEKMTIAMLEAIKDLVGNANDRDEEIAAWSKLLNKLYFAFAEGLDKAIAERGEDFDAQTNAQSEAQEQEPDNEQTRDGWFVSAA